MEVNKFLNSYSSYDELASAIAKIASDDSDNAIELLSDFIRLKDPDSTGKHYTPKIACIALLNKGKRGVDKLLILLSEISGHLYTKSILDCLWFASKNFLSHLAGFYSLKILDPIKLTLDEETVSYAKNAFYDAVISMAGNDELFWRFSESMIVYKDYLEKHSINMNISNDVFTAFSDSSIKISQTSVPTY